MEHQALDRLMPSQVSRWQLLRGKLRRFYLTTFRKEYVAAQEARRGGECVQCGRCCKLLFKCPFLGGTEEHPICLIYRKGQPFQCIAFPIDERDLADVGFQCSYTFSPRPSRDPDVPLLSLSVSAPKGP